MKMSVQLPRECCTNYTAFCTDLAKPKLALDVPVYTISSACVNFAFDSVYHKLDLSEPPFYYFCKVNAKAV